MNHLEEAKRLLQESKHENALTEIKKAIEENPADFKNWLTNFEILKELAKESSDKEKKKNYFDEAIKSIDKVIELDGEKANYYDRKSWIYDDNKDYESAIKCSTRAIELDSSNPNYYNNKADHYYNSNDYKSAIIDYTKAIELDKNNFIHYILTC